VIRVRLAVRSARDMIFVVSVSLITTRTTERSTVAPTALKTAQPKYTTAPATSTSWTIGVKHAPKAALGALARRGRRAQIVTIVKEDGILPYSTLRVD
jgi:hypothetical protein